MVIFGIDSLNIVMLIKILDNNYLCYYNNSPVSHYNRPDKSQWLTGY